VIDYSIWFFDEKINIKNSRDGVWDFIKHDFIIVIHTIKFNTFMEV